MTTEIEKLPHLIQRATAALEKATTAAEVLEAHDLASVGYSAAKKMAQLAKAKGAHDTVLAACRKTMADLLVIEARAKCRLADEYDAAQELGDVQKAGGARNFIIPNKNNENPTVADIGLTSKQVHEARAVRNAEQKQPGIVRKTVEERLLTNEEPTHADVKRAVKNMTQAKTEGTQSNRSKLQPRRRKNTSDDANVAARLILDERKTYPEVEAVTGLSNIVLRSAVAREEGRREPQIDRSDLSMTAQQKLDAAIRQHKTKLGASFHQTVNTRVQEFLMDTILPKHRQEQEEAKRVMDARRGVMDKQTFDKIRRALHPDSRNSISDKKLAEAFDEFMRLEKRLLDEKNSPTEFQTLPRTWQDWEAAKRKATAARKAKYAASRSAVKLR